MDRAPGVVVDRLTPPNLIHVVLILIATVVSSAGAVCKLPD